MKCEHSVCTCEARANERYCSEECRSAAEAKSREAVCSCGHAECAQSE